MINQKLNESLKRINVELKNRSKLSVSKVNVRKKLTDNLGSFKMLCEMSAEKILSWTGGRPIVAVDGSVNTVGSTFPYVIYLFQAQAKVSDKESAILTEIFSPLIPSNYEELDSEAAEGKTSPEQALLQKIDCILTELELKVAMESINKYRPFLIMFDGGFARFEKYAFQEWLNYQRLALSVGVLTVGVIEEAKSFGLSCELGLNKGRSPVYDREILFGLMKYGECFMPDNGNVVKKRGYYTAFSRLSKAPQAIACDFFNEQSVQALKIMNYLYSITPAGSRGIPMLLDMVDAEVRLSSKELEMFFTVNLDADIREKFFVANRKRRDY